MFRVGQYVVSKSNDITYYEVIKVNKESMDVKAMNINPGRVYQGQEFSMFKLVKGILANGRIIS